MADRPQVSRRGTSPNSGRAATAAFVHYRFVAAIFRSRQNGTQCTHLPTSDRRRCRAFSQSVRALLRRRIITSRRQKMMHSHRGHFCPWLPWIGSGSIFAGNSYFFRGVPWSLLPLGFKMHMSCVQKLIYQWMDQCHATLTTTTGPLFAAVKSRSRD